MKRVVSPSVNAIVILCATVAGLFICPAIASDHATTTDTEQLRSERPMSADATREERVRSYFSAFSSGDSAMYKGWLEQNRAVESLASAPMDARLVQYEKDFAQWGKIELLGVRQGNDAIQAEVKTSNGEKITFDFSFEGNAPHRVSAINLRLGSPPQMELSIPESWSSLQELADLIQAESKLPAIALGVYRSGAYETAVAGERIVGSGELARPDDAFHWGSIGKSVTGTIIGALIDQKKLDWDTTIGEVLGDVPMRNVYRDVSLWELMSHQSGLPAFTDFGPEFIERIKTYPGTSETDKRAGFVAEVLQDEPLFAPGTSAVYSNAGPTVAGYMAEKVSGLSWQELVQQHVLDPLEMKTAGFGWPVSMAEPDGVRGHFEEAPGKFTPRKLDEYLLDPEVVAPAGGLHSSIGDMLKYGAMHVKGMNGIDGPISAETIRGLHTLQPGQIKSFGETYTFGWGQRCPFQTKNALECHGHNGGAGTFYAQLLLLPNENIVIAYMASSQATGEMISAEVFKTIVDRYLNARSDNAAGSRPRD